MDTSRIRTILVLALPIIGGMVSQNVLNLVDTAMVGSLGEDPLAAVGIASFVNFMSIAFVTGLSAGVQAMAARRLGEGRHTELAAPLNGGLLLALIFSIPITVACYLGAPRFFPLLLDDPNVLKEAIPYYQVRIVAMVAVGMNFSFRGYWNGVNLSRLYLRTLVVMHVVNIALNYLLIFGKLGFPELGAVGAGIGTSISIFIGLVYYVIQGLMFARDSGFLKGLPDGRTMWTMLTLAIPTAIQQFLFASGMTALFGIIAMVGTTELAAANVLVNLTLVAILPAIGLGLAAASLVGQALGRGDPEDAYRWGWDVVKVGVVLLTVICIPFWATPDLVLGVFLSEPHTIEVARAPLQLLGLTMFLDGVGLVLMNALLGAGSSVWVLVVAVSLQWLLELPIAYVVGPVMDKGLFWIWIVVMAYRGTQALVFAALWYARWWSKIKV